MTTQYVKTHLDGIETLSKYHMQASVQTTLSIVNAILIQIKKGGVSVFCSQRQLVQKVLTGRKL